MLKKKKMLAVAAAIAMTATAVTTSISAAALEGEGQSYTGNAAYIGTYMTTDYFGNSAFEVSFRYESFDPDGTYVDEEGEVKTIDYNDTFQFLVFDTQWQGWDKTIAGPRGVDKTTPPLTAANLDLNTKYSVTVPIATIEEKLAAGAHHLELICSLAE